MSRSALANRLKSTSSRTSPHARTVYSCFRLLVPESRAVAARAASRNRVASISRSNDTYALPAWWGSDGRIALIVKRPRFGAASLELKGREARPAFKAAGFAPTHWALSRTCATSLKRPRETRGHHSGQRPRFRNGELSGSTRSSASVALSESQMTSYGQERTSGSAAGSLCRTNR